MTQVNEKALAVACNTMLKSSKVWPDDMRECIEAYEAAKPAPEPAGDAVREALDLIEAVESSFDLDSRPALRDRVKRLRDALAASPATSAARGGVPDGWKLVPIEPTPEMRTAGRDMLRGLAVEQLCTSDAADTFRAMLAASPAPQGDAT